MSQGLPYGFVGATAPALLGALHDATDGWSLPLVLVTAALVVSGVLLIWSAARSTAPRSVPWRAPATT